MIDEVLVGQLSTVVRQSAHRAPHESLIEHYGLLAKAGHTHPHAHYPCPLSKYPCPSPCPYQVSRQLDHDDVEVPRIGPVARAALERLRHKLTTCADVSCGQDYPGPWHGIVHGDLHGGNIMVDSRSCAAQLNSLQNSARDISCPPPSSYPYFSK